VAPVQPKANPATTPGYGGVPGQPGGTYGGVPAGTIPAGGSYGGYGGYGGDYGDCGDCCDPELGCDEYLDGSVVVRRARHN
jgi:hypothetical protein